MAKGVSVDFFCRAVDLLDKKYPNRVTGQTFEDFRATLERAEEIYRQLPEIAKEPCKPPSSTSPPPVK
jgi:hypothetical protein